MASVYCGSVLVVDDDENLRAFLSELLTLHGFRVWTAATGEDALTVARREGPDIVILDVNLPGMSGYDVCRHLRVEFGERLPILFVSGSRTESFDRVAGLRLGGDDYIIKPFAPDELLARIDRFIEHTPPEAERESTTSSRLTRRELQVLKLLAGGLRPKEIAHELSVSRKTISTHVQNILIKLDVHSQAQAVSAAYRIGLIDTPPGDSDQAANAGRVVPLRRSSGS